MSGRAAVRVERKQSLNTNKLAIELYSPISKDQLVQLYCRRAGVVVTIYTKFR